MVEPQFGHLRGSLPAGTKICIRDKPIVVTPSIEAIKTAIPAIPVSTVAATRGIAQPVIRAYDIESDMLTIGICFSLEKV